MTRTKTKFKGLVLPYEVFAGMVNETACYQLSARTEAMFLAFVDYAEWKTRWYKSDGSDLTEDEINNIKQWAARAAYELMSSEGCPEDHSDCIGWGNMSRVIEYFPNHPNDQTTPPGYLFPPWYIAPDFNVVGAPTGAVVTDITRFPYNPLTPAESLPRFRIFFSGKGTVELHLVSIYAGGNALIQVDGDLGQIEIIDLNQDLIAAPPETEDIVIIERTFEMDGDHFIDVTMVPVLQNEIPPVLFGGGISKIVFCGEDHEEPDGDELEFLGCDEMAQYTQCWFATEDGYILRYSLNGGCTWTDTLDCDGNPLIFPGLGVGEIPPVEPIDQPGSYPDPDKELGNPCKLVNSTFWATVFGSSNSFFGSIMLIPESAGARAYALAQFLDALDTPGNGLQWYEPFSKFMEKYLPYLIPFSTALEASVYPDYFICIVYECLPPSLIIDRSVLECMADAIDALDDGTHGDLDDAFHFYADWFRIYPISLIRASAFTEAINPEGDSTCPDCDDIVVPSCDPLLVTFDPGSSSYVITVGLEGFGRSGLGAKGIDLSPNTLGTGGLSKENAQKVTIPVAGCYVKSVFLRHRLTLANPTPNANARIIPPLEIRVRGIDGVLTGSLSPRESDYYYNWASGWKRIGGSFTVPPYATSIEVFIPYATGYPLRTFNNVIDEIEIELV